ncbi:MAG: DUF883 domain-containing protein [Gammaproteobacteria bacterium]|nr:DUF883 domain-containing protein [Gammaproteobacteria bacterium]
MSEVTTRTLIDDLHAVVADAEALVAATAGDVSDRARHARQKATDSVEAARTRLAALEADLKRRAKAVRDDATEYVQDNPWQSVGIAAAVGVVIGVLLGRR